MHNSGNSSGMNCPEAAALQLFEQGLPEAFWVLATGVMGKNMSMIRDLLRLSESSKARAGIIYISNLYLVISLSIYIYNHLLCIILYNIIYIYYVYIIIFYI